MSPSFQPYSADGGRHPLFWPFLISVAGHLLLGVFILINPAWQTDDSTYLLPGAISVQMVGPPAAGGSNQKPGPPGDTAPEPKAPPKPAPKVAPKAEPEPVMEKAEPQEAPEPVVVPKPDVQADISIAPKQPKPKTALKYKTVKSKEELQKALKQLEQKVEDKTEQMAEQANTRQLQDTLKRLKDQVAKQERPGTGASGAGGGGGGSGTPGAKAGSAGGVAGQGEAGGFGQGGQEEPELIDLYRLEVAFQIQKNWAYAGGADNLVAMVVFKVMPDGTIPEKEIFFTDRSGNASLDDSAYRAIVKSSPTKPHPPGIRKAFVEIGLRFTPKGVQ